MSLTVRNQFERDRIPKQFEGKSRTRQSEAEAADINFIVRRWQSTGALEHVMRSKPTFGDFSNVTDYQTAIERVQDAQDAFDALPADVRDACDNDVAGLFVLLDDPGRREELEKLGMADLADWLHGPRTEEQPAEPAPSPPPAEPGPEPEGD